MTYSPFWQTLFSADRGITEFYAWTFNNTITPHTVLQSTYLGYNKNLAFYPNTYRGVTTALTPNWNNGNLSNWSLSLHFKVNQGSMARGTFPIFTIADDDYLSCAVGVLCSYNGAMYLFNDDADSVREEIGPTFSIADDGAYHHLFVTYNAVTQYTTMYVDGVNRGSVQYMDTSLFNVDWLYLGAWDMPGEVTTSLDGAITAVRMFTGNASPMLPSDVVGSDGSPVTSIPTQFASSIHMDYDFLDGSAVDKAGNHELFQNSTADVNFAPNGSPTTLNPTTIDEYYTLAPTGVSYVARQSIPTKFTAMEAEAITVDPGLKIKSTYMSSWANSVFLNVYRNCRYEAMAGLIDYYHAPNYNVWEQTWSVDDMWSFRVIDSVLGTSITGSHMVAGFPRFSGVSTVGGETLTTNLGPDTLEFLISNFTTTGYFWNGLPWRVCLYSQYNFQIIASPQVVPGSNTPTSLNIEIYQGGTFTVLTGFPVVYGTLLRVSLLPDLAGGLTLTVTYGGVTKSAPFTYGSTASNLSLQYHTSTGAQHAGVVNALSKYNYLNLIVAGNNWIPWVAISSPRVAVPTTLQNGVYNTLTENFLLTPEPSPTPQETVHYSVYGKASQSNPAYVNPALPNEALSIPAVNLLRGIDNVNADGTPKTVNADFPATNPAGLGIRQTNMHYALYRDLTVSVGDDIYNLSGTGDATGATIGDYYYW